MELSFSSMIGVAVGLVVVYYILSLIVSSITDLVTKWFDLRAKDLLRGLRELIDKPEQIEKLMNHRLVAPLKTQRLLPSPKMEIEVAGKKAEIPHIEDIPAREFALALFDVVAPDAGAGDGPTALNGFRETVTALPDGRAKEAVLKFTNSGVKSIQETRALAEGWFDDTMKRVTELYRQQTRLISVVLALVIALALGVDSIALTVHLWHEPSARALFAERADQILQEQGSEADPESLTEDLKALNIPIFWWSDPPETPGGWIVKVIGTIITGLAAGLGSQFWYQVLKQLRPGASRPAKAAT